MTTKNESEQPAILTDQFLRKFGFKIYSREEGRDARWVRNGRVYSQPMALAIARGEAKLKR